MTEIFDAWALVHYMGEIAVMVVLMALKVVGHYAMQMIHASFTPFGTLAIAKHIQNVLQQVRMGIWRSNCGKRMGFKVIYYSSFEI